MFFEDERVQKTGPPIVFYVGVFTFAWLTRRFIDVLGAKYFRKFKDSDLYVFLMEFIATAQMCTCVYENGIIVKHFGWQGFGTIVAILLFAGSFFNRGAFVNPLVPIELFYYGVMTWQRTFITLAAQCLGGWAAFRLAMNLWFWSADYSLDHALALDPNCTLRYKIGPEFVILWELVGTFLLRTGIAMMPLKLKTLGVPVMVAGFLSFAMVWVGIPALNPLVVSSRLWGCRGVDDQWFILYYWIIPLIGWLSASKVTGPLIRPKSQPQPAIQQSKGKKKTHQFASKSGKRKTE
ncbi:unnamed protein product, partial [Mesorhabditis belari]|uniref:Aquaporin n=1 Tax=Mesorhabditis belari TaxID=2138241 RepID=A0AAF3J2T9_9BILA